MELKVGDRVVANYNGQNLRGPVRMVHATAVHVATGKGMRLIPISAIIRVNNRSVKVEEALTKPGRANKEKNSG